MSHNKTPCGAKDSLVFIFTLVTLSFSMIFLYYKYQAGEACYMCVCVCCILEVTKEGRGDHFTS